MAEFSNIYNIIEDQLSLDLGNPGFNISTLEQGIKDSAIRLGSLDYYRCFPFTVRQATKYTMEYKNLTIPFKQVFLLSTPKIPEEQLKHCHFLGVLRANLPSWRQISNPNNWDRQLLGVQLNPNQFDPLKQIASETFEDMSHGQVQYDIDRINSKIIVMQPFGVGQIVWDFAIGFDTPEFCEMTKVDSLCKFISCRFIEAIIQARAGIELEGKDFSINVQYLEKKLEDLKAQVSDIRKKCISYIAQWS